MRNIKKSGFTLIELLTVIMVITILAGLVLSAASYIRRKGAISRATGEIKAMENACEAYKTDNGAYPALTGTTDKFGLLATGTLSIDTSDYNPAGARYTLSSRYLYSQLSGDTNLTGQITAGAKQYMEFKPYMLALPNPGQQVSPSNIPTAIIDPFGYSYGYSTGTNGFNPPASFDLWSTAGTNSPATSGTQAKWIKNW